MMRTSSPFHNFLPFFCVRVHQQKNYGFMNLAVFKINFNMWNVDMGLHKVSLNWCHAELHDITLNCAYLPSHWLSKPIRWHLQFCPQRLQMHVVPGQQELGEKLQLRLWGVQMCHLLFVLYQTGPCLLTGIRSRASASSGLTRFSSRGGMSPPSRGAMSPPPPPFRYLITSS